MHSQQVVSTYSRFSNYLFEICLIMQAGILTLHTLLESQFMPDISSTSDLRRLLFGLIKRLRSHIYVVHWSPRLVLIFDVSDRGSGHDVIAKVAKTHTITNVEQVQQTLCFLVRAFCVDDASMYLLERLIRDSQM